MPKLINVGSLAIDIVYTVPRIAGAGETIASSQRQLFPGGKGLNQSIAAARAGAQVMHVGAVGEDGDWLLDLMQSEGVDIGHITRLEGPSGHAIIQVNESGENAIVISGGTNRALTREQLTGAVKQIGKGDWLLLQNETNDIAETIELAARSDGRVAINVAPTDGQSRHYPLQLVNLLVVNGQEAMDVAGEQSPDAAFQRLCQELPQTDLVLTEGKLGLRWRDADSGATGHVGTYDVTPVDETAAGDSFVGFLMAQLVAGQTLPDALPIASAAGALAVTKAGAATSIPTLEAVRSLAENPPLD